MYFHLEPNKYLKILKYCNSFITTTTTTTEFMERNSR